ncbi:caspase family protein [Actinocrispum sp. NPDC049592]|uniref:caspase, EACC1-associated type n=1 Tax=Actinocrispum sp. NPDC049592 TaxID=3154835 RepID=UPI0034250493
MGRRLALLIATFAYQDAGLRKLAAPAHDAESLAEVLADKRIAGFEVTTLINEPHHKVGEAIGEFYRDSRRDDLTLLYFTGHGLKDDDGRLYLAMTNTKRDSLLFTSLPADQVDQAMSSCLSRQQVLILDCCYSGAFPAGKIAKGDDSVQTLERFGGRGRTVLTASDSTQYSFEGNKLSGSGAQSLFTRFLVEGLRDGSADLDHDGDITLDELYFYARDRVVAEMPRQRPKRQDNGEGRTLIARNVNWSLPPRLRSLINSPIANDRVSALDELAQLYRTGNDHVRTEVLNQITLLGQDDSKTVSLAAAERLTVLKSEPQERREPVITAAPKPPPRSRVRQRRKLLVGAAVGAIAVTLAAIFLPRLWPAEPPGTPTATDQRLPPGGIAVSRDWSRLYVANFATRSVSVIDPVRGVVLDNPIRVGERPAGLAVAPDGKHVYVADSDDSTVTAINIAARETSATKVPRGPFGVATALDRPYVYVTSFDAATVSVIEATNSTIVGDPVKLAGHPLGVALHPHGHRIYVADDTGTLSVIDTATNKVEAVRIGGYPYGVVIGPQGVKVHVTMVNPNALITVDTATNKVIGETIALPPGPFALAVGDNDLVYVGSFDMASLVAVNTTTGATVGEPLKLPVSPRGITALDKQARRLAISDGAGGLCFVDTQTRVVSDPISLP